MPTLAIPAVRGARAIRGLSPLGGGGAAFRGIMGLLVRGGTTSLLSDGYPGPAAAAAASRSLQLEPPVRGASFI